MQGTSVGKQNWRLVGKKVEFDGSVVYEDVNQWAVFGIIKWQKIMKMMHRIDVTS